MKGLTLFLISILLIIPLNIFAATSLDVLTVNGEASRDIINYSGTTDIGVHAVMCKLYNDSNDEIDMLSSGVEDNKFTGSFLNVDEGMYVVACANYDGGEFKKAEIVVSIAKSDIIDTTNPETFDNILSYVLILGISLLVIIGGIIYFKRKK